MRARGIAAITSAGLCTTCVNTALPDLGVEDSALGSRELPVLQAVDQLGWLDAAHGLDLDYPLGGPRGLADGSALLATAESRTAVEYLVRCALPAGRSITKHAPDGVAHQFAGLIGVAPGWETGSCDDTCQEWISACMLAHVNTAGERLPLWVVADERSQPQIGWGLDPAFPNQEGAYFGNLFRSPPVMHYCAGRDFDANPVPGRIGWDDDEHPYLNPWGDHAACARHCEPAAGALGESGFVTCLGYQAVLTVWRP